MKNVRWSLLPYFSTVLILASALQAATPPNGAVSEASTTVTWSGGILPANPDLLNSPRCAGSNASKCDNFSLTISPPAASYGPYVVEIYLFPKGDWDLEVYTPNGSYLKGSGNGAGAPEFVLLDAPVAGTYRIAAFPFSPATDTTLISYTGKAELKHKPPSAPANGTENVAYATFPCPTGQTCTSGFGEPSIGVNWKTGAVMFAGGGTLKTFRITNFNDQATPPTATWTNVGVNQHIATSPRLYADPILFTDSRAGRTFAGQLEGLTPFCTTEYTDDDGATWIPTQGSGIAAGIDHETYGGGPLAPPLTRDPALPRPAYPDGVYYCAQSGAGPAQCAISLDGGLTYGPSVPMWTTECGGLHGHIKIAPDGTAYVPNKSCTGRQGFAVSTDNGMTWTIRTVPGSAGGDSDPSVGIGADGTVYVGFSDGDGHPKIAVTHDRGVTWDTYTNGESFTDVGTPFGIKNSVFPAVVAGDAGRAAFAFHGTPAAGAFQDASFTGVWDLYVAQTYDGGKTWTTVKASPDPTQRGCIWLGGGSNPCRNLLDFMDASIDEAGRVVVGYADGCTGTCATDPANFGKSVWATIARQSAGKRMFAQFDPSQGNPACTLPGSTVVVNSAASSSDGIASHHIVSAAVAYPYTSATAPDLLSFTIKAGSLGTLTPSTIYYTSFTTDGKPEAAGNVFGVRMVVSETGAVSFQSYVAGASNSGAVDGRFVTTTAPAEAGSKYNADGTITIIVKPSAVGISSTDGTHSLTNFNGAVAATAAGVVTAILDSMPSGANTVNGQPITRAAASFTVRSNQTCRPSLPATHYGVSAPATVQSGSAFNVTVTALDANNATATAYIGTVHFSSSDSAALLPANYTFTAGDAGVHAFSATLNTAGSQSITATDNANSSITGGASVTVAITQTATTTTLSSSPNPSTSGQAVTFTATVSPSAATGTVTFKDGATAIGTGTLSGGTATFTTSSLSVGTHSITAAYGGNISYASSTSAPLTQTVNQNLTGTPRYDILKSPPGLGDGWGEPSIGVNWNSERAFSNSGGTVPNGGTLMSFGGFGAGANITNIGATALRVTCSDCPSPAEAVWEKTASLIAAGSPRVYGDPILFTDHETGRTFVSQLVGLTPTAGTDYTDDDGRTIVPTQGSGVASGIDHQTIGGGPFHAPVPPGAVYKNAVYYCAQDVLNAAPANCALSIDGGLTYGPAVPVGLPVGTICGGIHGHVKVAPDGTVYVPHRFCGPAGSPQGMAISKDNGMTWTFTSIAGTATGAWDPSIGIASDGTVYFGFDDGDRHAKIAAYHPATETWGPVTDVGTTFGIQNTAFPAVVAGDPNRAAFAFLGTPTGGSDQAADFAGVWHLYVAHTFDGGTTWITSDLTPNDPVQRGSICAGGTGCGANRNLLDFFDATLDKEGRVVVGYADGCITPTCINGGANDNTAKNAIARQSGGKRMFSAFDPAEPNVPKAPAVSANLIGNTNRVFWSKPDHSGSPIGSYKLYRKAGSGSFNLVALLNTNSYDDTNIDGATTYSYRVTAVNAIGEGPYCGEATPVIPSDSCHPPGLLAVDDINTDGSDNDSGQNTPPDARVNLQRLYVAEPDLGGASKLVFTLYVKPSSIGTAPPSSQWYIIWNRLQPDANFDRWYVAMTSDALGTVSFQYGKFGVPTPIGGVPSTSTNQAVKVGDADSGSYDAATGKIVITLSTSKAENIQPGQTLAALNARTFLASPENGLKSGSAANDITPNGSYTLVGNCSSNHAPVAANDNYTVAEDAALNVAAPGVLANDSDADNNALAASLVSAPAHGTVSFSSNGSFTYTPSADFNGVDTFTYKASDGKLDSNVATVTVTVTPVNDPPVANNDAYAVKPNATLSVAAPGVLTNDGDVDSATLHAVLVTTVAHGALTLNADGSFTYTPASGYKGFDSFTYKANDGSADSNVATVTINVTSDAARAVKVTGSGEVAVYNPDGVASFGFNVKRDSVDGAPSGQLNYYNHARNLTVQSTSITSLNVSGTTATFSGTCTKNGAPCTFTVTAEDNGEPGKGIDRFTIAVSDEPLEGGPGPITSGNVQIK